MNEILCISGDRGQLHNISLMETHASTDASAFDDKRAPFKLLRCRRLPHVHFKMPLEYLK